MRVTQYVGALAFALSMIVTSQAFAQVPILIQRCQEDSLDPTQATQRDAWYVQFYPGEVLAFAQTQSGDMTLTQEDAVAWFNDFMLNDPVKHTARKRPLYPTFGLADYTNPAPSYFAYPNPKGAQAGNRGDVNGADKPANYAMIGTCLSSCYKPGTELLFSQDNSFSYVPIEQAQSRRLQKVAVLSDASTMDEPSLIPQDVQFYVSSVIEDENKILDFATLSGGVLKVTTNHPILDGTGHMREADTFAVGEDLVRADGGLDPIVSITPETYFGRVYNIYPRSASLQGQIVVANGFLNGSAWYQNDGQEYLNRIVLRGLIPTAALE